MEKRILASKEKNKFFFVGDTDKDFHSQFGIFEKSDLKKGGKIKSKKDVEFSCFEPSFIDFYKKISRLAQIIPLKDIGIIITECGINKNSVVFDAGSGSGGISLFLANFVKKVITYDIREDHLDVVKKNIEKLELKNITPKLGDVYTKISDKDADIFILDLPEPWKAIDTAINAIKPGGFIVSYSPSITQSADFVNAVNDNPDLIHIKTLEIIQREWEIKGRKVRPVTAPIGHSGFISFVRKI